MTETEQAAFEEMRQISADAFAAHKEVSAIAAETLSMALVALRLVREVTLIVSEGASRQEALALIEKRIANLERTRSIQ